MNRRSKNAVIAATCLWFVSLVACSDAPVTMAPTDWDNNPSLAASCDYVVPLVGDRDFYFSIGKGEKTCVNYVAQDECALSVFRDCIDENAQWAGVLNAQNRLDFYPVREQSGPEQWPCKGTLSNETLEPFGRSGSALSFVSGSLTCNNGLGPVVRLQSVLPQDAHVPVGEDRRVYLRRDINARFLLPKTMLIKNAAVQELWAVFSGSVDGDTDSTLDTFAYEKDRPVAEVQSSLQRLAISNLNWITSFEGASQVWASAANSILAIDIATKMPEVVMDLGTEIGLIEAHPSGRSIYVTLTSSVTAGTTILQKWNLSPRMDGADYEWNFERQVTVGHRIVTHLFLPTRTSSLTPELLLVAGYPNSSIYSFNENLEVSKELLGRKYLQDVTLIDDRERLAVLETNSRMYREMDYLGNWDESSALWVPWLEQPVALAYDQQGQRMFIAGLHDEKKSETKDQLKTNEELRAADYAVSVLDLKDKRSRPERLLLREVANLTQERPLKILYDRSESKIMLMITNQADFFDIQSPW